MPRTRGPGSGRFFLTVLGPEKPKAGVGLTRRLERLSCWLQGATFPCALLPWRGGRQLSGAPSPPGTAPGSRAPPSPPHRTLSTCQRLHLQTPWPWATPGFNVGAGGRTQSPEQKSCFILRRKRPGKGGSFRANRVLCRGGASDCLEFVSILLLETVQVARS